MKNVPKLVGDEAKKKFVELSSILKTTYWPLYFVGPSGCGKSILAMNLAKWYSQKFGVPAYYVQLSPDQTKTSLILGLRLINGSLVPAKGVVAEAMDKGGIIIVDEATHALPELLLMFNSICDRTAIASIGDEVVVARDTFRVIFCGNTSLYSANIKLPQSFAQRLICINFKYPSTEDEVAIVKKMLKTEFGSVVIPDVVIEYVVKLARKVRNDSYPLSVRNMAAAVVLLQVKYVMSDREPNFDDAVTEFGGSQPEAVIRGLYATFNGSDPHTVHQALSDGKVRAFVNTIAKIGVDEFREAVKSAMMYYLDLDGNYAEIQKAKSRLDAELLGGGSNA